MEEESKDWWSDWGKPIKAKKPAADISKEVSGKDGLTELKADSGILNLRPEDAERLRVITTEGVRSYHGPRMIY